MRRLSQIATFFVSAGLFVVLNTEASAQTFDPYAEKKIEFERATREVASLLERALRINFNGNLPVVDFDRLQTGSRLSALAEYRPGPPDAMVVSASFAKCDPSPTYDRGKFRPDLPSQN